MNRKLVLASSSRYRSQLLARLQYPFESYSPNIDESPLANEQPSALVARLAQEKAKALASHFKDALIIGSDQVASLNGSTLGKPGHHEAALQQLLDCQGKTVTFYTGLCVYDSAADTFYSNTSRNDVNFRKLSKDQLDTYLKKDQPYDCAGSFKCESLGIALFTAIKGDDPNALIGLPLIALIDLLKAAGLDILKQR